MSNDMYLPALPIISHDFGTSLLLVQLTITAWLAGDTAVQCIVGPLSDRYGRRPILFGGGVLFLLSTLGCALSPNLAFLIIARFLQGIGVCTMMVAGYASIHDLYSDKQAIHVLAWMGSAAVIAPAIGPVFGGLLLLVADWRVIFFILFILAAIALIALWFMMPESTSFFSRYRFNVKSLIASYRKILSNPSFMLSASAFGLLYGGVFGWITVSPFILMETLKLSPTEFGYLQLPVFGAYIVGAQVVKRLMDKFKVEELIFSGLIIAALSGIALVICALIAPSNLWSFIVPMAGYTMGFGVAGAPLNRTTLTATSEQKGTSIAVFYLTMTGIGTIISLILSIINETLFLACLVIALTVLLSFFLNAFRKKA
jgi:Bcr/CflA subfamily drug resistance transporter